MKLLSGKPFFTKTRIQFILRRIIFPFFAVYSVLAILTAIRDMNIKSDQYAAVLLSDHALTKYDYWASPSAFLGSYITWTYYFNNKDVKVKWFLRAKSTDLKRVIRDGNCQSIILVGHGSVNTWKATDMVVSNLEVEEMMNGVPKKKGRMVAANLWRRRLFSRKNGGIGNGEGICPHIWRGGNYVYVCGRCHFLLQISETHMEVILYRTW